ncbi:MAG: hypothetical protein M3Q58_10260 [Bacteroidota bacterium]|nr:hypothetical protein [Bacteroidota bacterium]
MTFSPKLGKFILTSHITFSVGWFGAVAVFLAFAITGVTSQDVLLARSAYLAMEVSGWFVIVPLCLASLLTGIIQALGTKWGLFKHYWIIVKLVLTIASTIVLLFHMKPISYLADLATQNAFTINDHFTLKLQLIADAGAALLVLLAITTISIYQPWGKVQSISKNKEFKKQTPGKTPFRKSWKLY